MWAALVRGHCPRLRLDRAFGLGGGSGVRLSWRFRKKCMKRRDYETSFTKGQILRVLLLEDDPDHAKLWMLALEKGGYCVKGDVVATRAEFAGCLESKE